MTIGGLAGHPAARLRGVPPRARLTVAVALLVLAVLGGGWLWLRDSSLVAVRHVTIRGLAGGDAPAVRAALRDAALRQTTLDADPAAIRRAVAAYPVVGAVRIRTDFPHGMRIDVVPRDAVATVAVGGGRLPVSADGTLLRGGAASPSLPTIDLPAADAAGRVSGARARAAVALMAAAPQPLARHVDAVKWTGQGLTTQLHDGPVVYFGAPGRDAAKWAAAAAVLADPGSKGASYVDVRLPERPVAGGLPTSDTTTAPTTTSPVQSAIPVPTSP